MRIHLLILLAAACVIAGCRGDSTTSTPTPALTSTSTAVATPSATATAAPITASNVSKLRAVASFRVNQPVRLVWAGDGRLFVASTRRVDAVDVATGATSRVFEVQEPETIVDIHRTGIAAVADAQGSVRLVEVHSGNTLQTLAAGGPVRGGNFFGARVVLSRVDIIEASIWEVGSGAKTATLRGFETAAPVYAVTVSPDGNRAAWVARGTLQFADVAASTMGPRVQFEDFIGAYAFSGDSRLFATVTGGPAADGGLAGRLQLWDPATGNELRRMEQPGLLASVAFAPREPVVAAGGDGVTLWNSTDGMRLGGPSQAEAGDVRLLAFSSDGAMLATIADDGSGRIWRPGP